MTRLSRKPIRMILMSLLLLLILTLAIFGAQLLAAKQASARAPDITIAQWTAIMGGEQLLLESTEFIMYLPTVYK
jgi:hypothetical protein